ncbi:polyphosphate kinase 2 family protein [Humisphaera borealis]|uniref:Polyphosphate kinase 2 family protein n=1 Tax=Humisphaera borealis TaxID=2807512 RepID=A0A7M2WWL1_9BACT|nr:polyphosphate kinase 2 family protein [Humisphaera borealis]QOV89928.1 polyphosphate kinase 2 family protein [Humisphaera borealis]
MLADSPYLVTPGKKFKLSDRDPDDTGDFKNKTAAVEPTQKNLEQLDELQELLYAEGKHALLVVFQAMDTAGKDGSIEHVFSGLDPQGCMVASFKVPTTLEKSHDFLWRCHQAVPPKGMIGIFNRSHYEAVLVERVMGITTKDVWSRRFDHINAFERLLADEGVTIVKFYLHISKEEQKKRLQARLDDPAKQWKFAVGDLDTRKRWDEYMEAYQDALRECSTEHAPWYVVPSDRKWFRNWVISDTIVRTLKKLKMEYPPPEKGLDQIVID